MRVIQIAVQFWKPVAGALSFGNIVGDQQVFETEAKLALGEIGVFVEERS